MPENIAEQVRHEQELVESLVERGELATQAWRLWTSLQVTEKWLESADAEDADTLGSRAQYMRDEIEQEYARVRFEMELAERQRVFKQMKERRQDDELELPSEAWMRANILTDALIDAFVIVSQSDFERRYEVMGALLVAHEAADEECKRYRNQEQEGREDVTET